MCCVAMNNLFILLNILIFMICGVPSSHGYLNALSGSKVLNVGEELWRENLLLPTDYRFYRLEGLKPNTLYEVKISYPASIPVSFSIQVKRNFSDLGLNQNRRLLNTEKLIFKTDDLGLSGIKDGIYALVTVESAGVLAMPYKGRAQQVIYNIVCDKLLLGLSDSSRWIGYMTIICLGLAWMIPYFLPAYLRKS